MALARLDRVLANLGYGSRRDVRRVILDGRVFVRGEVVRDETRKVDAHEVTVDGKALDHPDGIVVMLHKPTGVVCSHDEGEGPTVFELLPERWSSRNPRVESVGRLDKDSSGLLLLTDDHQLLHRLTSPRHHVPKRYEVELDDDLPDGIVERFAAGTLLLAGDPDPCRPAELEPTGPRSAAVVLTEGRYHQVRRMFAACGRTVVALHRSHVGDLALGDLAPGAWVEVPQLR